MKAIAILSPSRARVLPNLAISREQGSPEVTVDIWGAFFLPKGTPGPIIHRLNQAASETLDTPSVGERLEGLGVRVPTPEHRSPGYLGKDCCGATSKVGLTESSPPESPDSGERRDGGEEDVAVLGAVLNCTEWMRLLFGAPAAAEPIPLDFEVSVIPR